MPGADERVLQVARTVQGGARGRKPFACAASRVAEVGVLAGTSWGSVGQIRLLWLSAQ